MIVGAGASLPRAFLAGPQRSRLVPRWRVTPRAYWALSFPFPFPLPLPFLFLWCCWPGGVLPAPWIALHGIQDSVCPVGPARAFVQDVPGARFLPLPGVGHSYTDMRRWWGAFISSYEELTLTSGGSAPVPPHLATEPAVH